jgi:hypothetical protein
MRTLLIVAGLAAATAIPAAAQVAGMKASTNRTTASTFATSTTSAAGDNAVSSSPSTPATTSSVAAGNAVQVQNVSTNPLGPTTQTEPAFRPGGPFSNDSGNSALGTSAGQSSSGTAAGNSSAGIGPDGLPIATNPDGTAIPDVNNPTVAGTASLVPEGNGSFAGVNRQATSTVAVPVQNTPTPLFNQAAREGRAREQARRARGDEPRVYGIAPNTERDLTWQMPDDRIIRY